MTAWKVPSNTGGVLPAERRSWTVVHSGRRLLAKDSWLTVGVGACKVLE